MTIAPTNGILFILTVFPYCINCVRIKVNNGKGNVYNIVWPV